MSAALTGFEVVFPRKDVRSLFRQIERAQKELGKGVKDSVLWSGKFVADSLAAATKQAPKLRPVVRNKDKRAGRDTRVARYGVHKYRPNGERYFLPLGQTSRGRTKGGGMDIGPTIIRYVDKRTSAVIDWDKSTGKRKRVWENVSTAPDVANPELSMPGIMSDPRRQIKRSGLAKQSWKRLSRIINRGGVVHLFRVLASSTEHLRAGGEFLGVRIVNNLKYMDKALGRGRQTVDGVFARAGDAMANRIDDRVKKMAGKINR